MLLLLPLATTAAFVVEAKMYADAAFADEVEMLLLAVGSAEASNVVDAADVDEVIS